MSVVSLQFRGRPILDLASYARRGPRRRDRISRSDLDIIRRTASRTPEVMVKVSGGGSSVQGVAAHFNYIDRKGKLDLETDDGQQLNGKGVEEAVLADWNLEDELAESSLPYSGKSGRRPVKLVHNLILSMPAGTSPDKLYAASKEFAREQFALKNRYAMVLHTDQEHPHVHLVVKAMGEDGHRLNIRKANLREWRSEFARHLRAQGVAANATERAVRDQGRAPKSDGRYRADLRRGDLKRGDELGVVSASSARAAGPTTPAFGISKSTRQAVAAGWQAVARMMKEMNYERAEETSRDNTRSALPETPARAQHHERDDFSR